MVVSETIIAGIKSSILNEFDTAAYMGFGTGTTPRSASDTTLEGEVQRNAFDETSVKNVTAGTYDFSGTLGLTEGNGNDIANVGVFDLATGGDLFASNLLGTSISKTDSLDISVGLRVTVEVINL
jgi:hypothetical protein